MKGAKGALIYMRVSTDQKRQPSFEEQLPMCMRALLAMGYTLLPGGVYQDEVSRGTRRADLHRMLERCDTDPQAGAVFVWIDTRLYGHPEQQRRIHQRLADAGVLLFDKDHRQYKMDTSKEVFTGTVLGAASEFEVLSLHERIYDTHLEKAIAGKIVSRPPFGIVHVKKVVETADGPEITGEFRRNDFLVGVINQMYRWVERDGLSTFSIAQRLKAMGITSATGNEDWTATSVRRILINRFYVGEMVWNRYKNVWRVDHETGDKVMTRRLRPEEEWITGPSPFGCLLNPNDPTDADGSGRQLFEDVQRILASRSGRHKRREIYGPHLLDGLIYCGRCSKRMHVKRRGNKRANGERSDKYDYRCPGRINTGGKGYCPSPHGMSEDKIIDALIRLASFQAPEMRGQRQAVARIAPDPGLQMDRDRLAQAIAAADDEIKQAKRQLFKGRVDEDDFDEFVAEVTERVAESRRQLAEIEERLATEDRRTLHVTGDAAEAFARLLQGLTNPESNVPMEERQTIVATLIARIVIDNPNITVEFHQELRGRLAS